MPEDLTPEDQLCLLLARGRFSPDVAKRAVNRLEAQPCWEVLLERARTHGLIPLLYHRLRALDFRGVPQPVRRKLTDTFGINAIRNVLLTQELVRVLTQLGAAGVPVIPLKGIALAESLYGDPALRTCADLDILVHPKFLVESLHLLQSSGYKARCGEPALLRLLARYGKDCALMREDPRSVYPLQVHCGLIWGGPAERRLLAELWSDAAPRPFHAAPAYALSPEWEFLYLAVHAARHGLFPFKWLVDLDWLSVRGGLDWKKVQEKARRMGWEGAVQSCLAACAALLETLGPRAFCGNGASRGGQNRHVGPRASPNSPGNTLLLAAAAHPRTKASISRYSVICPHAGGLRVPSPSLLAVLSLLLSAALALDGHGGRMVHSGGHGEAPPAADLEEVQDHCKPWVKPTEGIRPTISQPRRG